MVSMVSMVSPKANVNQQELFRLVMVVCVQLAGDLIAAMTDPEPRCSDIK